MRHRLLQRLVDLLFVALDPFTNESAWILDTGVRLLNTFIQSDCTVAWLVTGSPDECRAFLGPWADRITTFSDPDRTVVKSLGLESLPALVHLAMDATVIAAAEGWHPREWAAVTNGVARAVSWTGPHLPGPKDPAPYDGTPALG